MTLLSDAARTIFAKALAKVDPGQAVRNVPTGNNLRDLRLILTAVANPPPHGE